MLKGYMVRKRLGTPAIYCILLFQLARYGKVAHLKHSVFCCKLFAFTKFWCLGRSM